MDKKKLTEIRALDTLVEQPESFEIETQAGDKLELKLYPLQLARLSLISRRLIELDMVFEDEKADDIQMMWNICAEKPRQVAEIVAIATLRTKAEIENELKQRTELIYWSPSMTTTAYVHLLQCIVFQSYHADFMRAIRSVKMLRVSISQETKAERIAHTAGRQYGAVK